MPPLNLAEKQTFSVILCHIFVMSLLIIIYLKFNRND